MMTTPTEDPMRALPEPALLKTPEGDYTDETGYKWAWFAHGYDTGMEPFFSAEQMQAALLSEWRPFPDIDGELVTPERLAGWLDAKFSRHHEEEDKWAADYIRATRPTAGKDDPNVKHKRAAYLLAHPEELEAFVIAAEKSADDWLALNREHAELLAGKDDPAAPSGDWQALALRYEAALRHIAETAFATKDWQYARDALAARLYCESGAAPPPAAAPSSQESKDAARVLAEFAKTAPGRLPQRVQDAIAVVAGASSSPTEGGMK